MPSPLTLFFSSSFLSSSDSPLWAWRTVQSPRKYSQCSYLPLTLVSRLSFWQLSSKLANKQLFFISPRRLLYQCETQPGNIFFRRLVRAKQEEYLKANKREKTAVAKHIVKLIRMLTPPGRFLRKDPKDENSYGTCLASRHLSTPFVLPHQLMPSPSLTCSID